VSKGMGVTVSEHNESRKKNSFLSLRKLVEHWQGNFYNSDKSSGDCTSQLRTPKSSNSHLIFLFPYSINNSCNKDTAQGDSRGNFPTCLENQTAVLIN
jgi:hypothetical protein